MDIADIVRKEAAWLARQEGPLARELLDIYRDVFAEIGERLKGLDTSVYTRNHLNAIMAQLRPLIQAGADSVSARLGEGVAQVYRDAVPREVNSWAMLERAFGDAGLAQQFAAFQPVIPQRAIAALVSTQDVAIKSFAGELTKQARRTIGQSLALGEGVEKAARRLAKLPGAPKNKARVRLVARMEMARATQEAKGAAIEQLNEQFPELEFWQLVKDKLDKSKRTRNHWFSWAISGTVRNVTQKEFFEVTEDRMAKARANYKRVTGRNAYNHGILWEKTPTGRRGRRVPAHYNDRAVLLAWRPAWGSEYGFGPILHPQGPVPKAGAGPLFV